MCYVGLTPDSVPCRPVGSYDRQCYLRRCGLRAAGCGLRVSMSVLGAGCSSSRVTVLSHCARTALCDASVPAEQRAPGAQSSCQANARNVCGARRKDTLKGIGSQAPSAQSAGQGPRASGPEIFPNTVALRHCGLRTSQLRRPEVGGTSDLRTSALRTSCLLPSCLLDPGRWQEAPGSWFLVSDFCLLIFCSSSPALRLLWRWRWWPPGRAFPCPSSFQLHWSGRASDCRWECPVPVICECPCPVTARTGQPVARCGLGPGRPSRAPGPSGPV